MNTDNNFVAVMHCDKVGRCLEAQSDFTAGQVLLEELAELHSQANTHSIQYQCNRHAHTFESGILKFAEHMCEPNCAVAISEAGPKHISPDKDLVRVQLIALKDISAGKRIGFNYNTTDWAFSDPFACECGRPLCVNEIRGFSFMSVKQRESLLEMVGDKYMSKGVLDNSKLCEKQDA